MVQSALYDRSVLHVLSGTGNTLLAAAWMRDVLAARGVPTRLVPVRKRRSAPPGQSQALSPPPAAAGARALEGFLFPTHGFTAPWLMIRYVLSLPRARGADAFVSASRAGWKAGVYLPGLEGTAGYLIALLLFFKGYRVRGVQAIDLPTNWIAAHPPLGARSVEHFLVRGRAKAERFIGRIGEGRTSFGCGSLIALILGLALLPVSLGYLVYGRFLLAKIFFASARCTGCGLCAIHCPAGAIRMRGRRPRPYWTFSCESCMRCLCCCPERAVEAGHSWAALLVCLTFVPVSVWLVNWLLPLAPWLSQFPQTWLHRIAHYVCYLLSILAAYRLFWLAIRIPPINALFTFTTFTRLWGRYRAPETKWGGFPCEDAGMSDEVEK
ncbi:MAG: 4Fe-4S binding protein [Planctomycetes bacterium]|nr:4Fe-4S binding protein [Planctomycetota bacterium]